MVQNYFEEILTALSVDIEIPNLHPDKKNTCLIFWKKKVLVYVQFDETEDNLLIIGKIGEVPLGRFRENVFRLSLQMNGEPIENLTISGVFAFSTKANELIFFSRLPKETLKREDIAAHFLFVAEKTFEWKEAIEKGVLPSLSQSPSPQGSGMFGLK